MRTIALVGVLLAAPSAAQAVPAALSFDPAKKATMHEAQYRGEYYRERRWDDDHRWRRQRYCERLRRACIYKDERGEWGQGNCRRYRYECGGRNW